MLKKVAEFDLPGPPGKRFDYLTIDADDRYLISAHLAAKQTYVIDLGTKRIVATIGDTPVQKALSTCPTCISSTRPTPTTTRLASWT
jgi:hypothetical protein